MTRSVSAKRPADRCDPEGVSHLVRTGDPRALERIAECYIGYLLGVGRCACRDPGGAPDAVHDALVAAAERLDQFRGDGSVKAWLSRMVVNACRCRERGRKNDAAWNLPLDEERGGGAAGGESPEDASVRAELAHELERALARLNQGDRELFVLSQIDGASAEELSRAVGITPAAVRARLTRIRRRLRRELAPVWRAFRAPAE